MVFHTVTLSKVLMHVIFITLLKFDIIWLHKSQGIVMNKEKELFKKETKAFLEGIISPKLFNFESPRPLKIGIQKDIYKLVEEKNLPIEKAQVQHCLRFYVRSEQYHKAVLSNQFRYDLEGNPFGEISEQEKVFSKIELEKREKQREAKREWWKNLRERKKKIREAKKSEDACL